jgi:hypothetical protein
MVAVGVDACLPVIEWARTSGINLLVVHGGLFWQGAQRIEVALNPAISDEPFVRRVFLDLVGRVPSIDETHDFFGSDYPAKRDRLIEPPPTPGLRREESE